MTETFVGGPIGAGASKTGLGCAWGIYTVTIVTTLDWIIFDDFYDVQYVHALTAADGVDAEAYIDGTTLNKVTVTGTGATVLLVMGSPANTD